MTRGRTVLLSVLSCLVVFAGLELLARAAALILDAPSSAQPPGESIDWLAYSPTIGWERKANFKGIAGGFPREFDAQGYFAADSAQVAQRNAHKRVLFMGDSNTFGFGATTPESFVEVAERQLRGVDAINIGVIGYTSFQGRLALAKQMPALKPDLVVVSFNVNDRRYLLQSSVGDSEEGFARTWRASRSWLAATLDVLDVSYFVRAFRKVLRAAGLLPKPLEEVDVSTLAPRVDPTAYRHNLEQIAVDAKALGIPVMFMILRDNPTQVAPLRAGVDALRRGDVDSAIGQLEKAAAGTPMFSSLARLYLAEALNAKGDKTRAAQVLHTRSIYNSFSGGQVVRLDTEYNDIMRDVAQRTGSEVVEGADALEQQPGDFIDYCHFNADGHRRLGELLAKKIAAKLGI